MNEIEVIPCVVDKNDDNGSFTSCDNAKLVELGGGYAHTLTTHEPSMSNHHCNMAIVKVKENTTKGYSECKIDGVCDLSYPDSKTRRGRVQDNGDTCPTITAESNGLCKVEQYRIRKLTPKECWRLMGFTDEDFSKAEKVNSNTQLYKQAGNSIVVNVLEALFAQLF